MSGLRIATPIVIKDTLSIYNVNEQIALSIGPKKDQTMHFVTEYEDGFGFDHNVTFLHNVFIKNQNEYIQLLPNTIIFFKGNTFTEVDTKIMEISVSDIDTSANGNIHIFQGQISIDEGNISVGKNTIISNNGISVGSNITISNSGISVGSNITISNSGINIDNNAIKLENGTITASSFYATSDVRLKTNIKPYTSKASILDLPIYEFDYKSNGQHTIGCLAQDLQKICPEIVSEDKDGFLHIEESKLVYLLLQEIKKLNKKQINQTYN